jgi:PAS domain S-box-containing protein
MRLRARLVSLVLAVLVPVVVVSTVMVVLLARGEQRAVEERLRDTARGLALAVDREAHSSVTALEALAASEAVTTRDLPTAYRRLGGVLPTRDGWQSITLLDAAGRQVLDVRAPLGAALEDWSERAVFREVRDQRAAVVSGLLDDNDGGSPYVFVGVPVLSGSEFAGVLGAHVDPGVFSRVLAQATISAGGAITLIDRDHVVVARTRDADGRVGRRAAEYGALAAARGREGILRGANGAGVDSYGAFSRGPMAGWSVIVNVPAASVEAPFVRALWGLGLAAGAAITIAVTLALLFGRRISRSITGLGAAVDRLARGEPPEVGPARVAEVDEVGRTLERASVLLRQRDVQRGRTAAELRAGNQILEALVSASPLAIMMLDAGGIVRMWNPACERLFGWRAEEVLDRVLPAVPSDQQGEFLATIMATLAGQPLRGVETRRRHRDGRLLEVRLFSAALPDASGRAAYALSLVDDITDGRRGERQRAAHHEVSRALTEAADIPAAGALALEAIGRHLDWSVGALWMVDAGAETIRCTQVWTANPRFRPFAAVSRETDHRRGAGLPGRIWLTGEPAWIEDVARDEHLPRTAVAESAGLRSAFGFPIAAGGRVLGVLEFFSVEERPRDVPLLELMATLGAQMGLFVQRRLADEERSRLLDVERAVREQAQAATTELRRLQAITDAALASLTVDDLLRELLARVRTVLGVDTAAVFMLDPERELLVMRAADGLESGVTSEPIPMGRGLVGRVALATGAAVVSEDVEQVALVSPFLERRGIRALLATPLVVAGRTTGVIRVGSRQPRAFGDDDGRLLQLVADRVAMAIDNAHLYEAERDARTEAEAASRAKDEFVAMLAHELRNPLAPIRAAIDVVGRLGVGDATVRRACEIVERQVAHLARLLDDLLDVARITRGKIELVKTSVDLRAAVDEALEATRPLLTAKAHRLTVQTGTEPLCVQGDRTRLVQIIGNLLNNAVKYTPTGGAIDVRAAIEDGAVTLRVRDTGVGIPAGMLDRVFDLFAQIDPSVARTEGGLGIGLTLVRSLVELHGGTVAAASEGPGRGSEFIVRLPVTPDSPAAGPARRPAVPARARRVLIVEDNADAAEILCTSLGLAGHDVKVATDGLAGVERALAETPEVMIVDVGLPGLDGYEVARRVRHALGEQVVLVALTGYGRPEDRRRTHEAGFDAHLVKPVDPAALDEIVRSDRAA